jgi:hypothetical protein
MPRGVFVVCLGLCLLAGFSCWLVLRPDRVSSALSEQIRRGPGTMVDFAQAAPFAWDRVYVFGPYTSHEHIHKSLGFHWGGIERTTIELNDGVNLVVFVRGRRVVHWFEHARHEELGDVTDPNGYAREETKFRVFRDGTEQRLALAPPN